MSQFLVVLAILIAGLVAFLAVGGSRRGRGRAASVLPSLGPAGDNLPSVLLPQEPSAADVDRVRFALGLRGYRMDQVDEVLDRLAGQLRLKDEQIDRLMRRVEDLGDRAGPGADDGDP